MQMNADGLQITVSGAEHAGAPLIWVPAFGKEGAELAEALAAMQDAPDCTLAVMDVPDWNGMLSPWASKRLYRRDSDFSGGADAFLQRMTAHAVPEVSASLSAAPAYHALAGYSLAGLFAVYALYRTDLFRRAASASGSFWYPSFADYAETHDFAAKPDAVSLSLGDREADARQPVLATVAQQTERIAALFRARGVPVQFVWNAGNHFQEPARRLASCICGMLKL